jgi:hypothetical protein
MTTLIRSLSRVMGSGGGGVLIDGPAIGKSMSAAPGVSAVSVTNTGPAGIKGALSLSQVDAFLAFPQSVAGNPAGRTAARFITYDSSGRLLITVDRQSAPLLLALFSEDITDYLSALMAPVATGIELSKKGYLELVEATYGRPVADEIAASRIRVILTLPRPVTSIRGGSAEGRLAQFIVPLPDLLVLESPLVYEISW